MKSLFPQQCFGFTRLPTPNVELRLLHIVICNEVILLVVKLCANMAGKNLIDRIACGGDHGGLTDFNL